MAGGSVEVDGRLRGSGQPRSERWWVVEVVVGVGVGVELGGARGGAVDGAPGDVAGEWSEAVQFGGGVDPRLVGRKWGVDGGFVVVGVGHALGEAVEAVGVGAVVAELFAVDVPVGGLSGAGGQDVGGLRVGLPAAGDRDGVLDGGALDAVDVVGVAKAQPVEVGSEDRDLAVAAIQADHDPADVAVGGEDLAGGAVLDAALAVFAVGGDEGDAVAGVQGVVDVGVGVGDVVG